MEPTPKCISDYSPAAERRAKLVAACWVLAFLAAGWFVWFVGGPKGRRYPVVVGQTIPVNHRMRRCLVRSVVVSLNRVLERPGDEDGATIQEGHYSITMDVVNTTSEPADITFGVGVCDAPGQGWAWSQAWTKKSTGLIQPGASKEVKATFRFNPSRLASVFFTGSD